MYLYVPYSDKETAKELGCKWDSDQRLWYCSKFNSNISMCNDLWSKRHEIAIEERVDLKVPYNALAIKSYKILEVVFYTSEQIKQRVDNDKIANEESIKNYINKSISFK